MSISIHHGERAALDNMLYRSENELTEIVRQKFTKASQSKTHPTKSINVKSTSNVLHFLHDTSPNCQHDALPLVKCIMASGSILLAN